MNSIPKFEDTRTTDYLFGGDNIVYVRTKTPKFSYTIARDITGEHILNY